MDAAMIDEAVAPLVNDTDVDVSTLMFPIVNEDDLYNPSVVKVVTDLTGKALYFSRSLIPYPRESISHSVFEHVGLYVYRKETLLRLTRLPATTLEKVESLEQLRWLEHGLRIRVTESAVRDKEYHGFSVDTREDIERAEQMLRERE
ncbi:MAG: 3-deoxy-manno-octulosonate cytidylyltransferase [Candidatus Hydrogenedentes bacterium ADurb.Bin179]|nr:MAG: 3-deoxy-manno-octulosonate cytidylyltransferase [Candidatus Hydrogenedentes bacterium ADurb.Bin179]